MRVYSRLQEAVRGGMQRLQDEVRPADPYRDIVRRTAFETLYGVQAPAAARYERKD